MRDLKEYQLLVAPEEIGQTWISTARFRATGDDEGRTLLPFYAAYRAAVKGKVEGMKHEEGEIPEADRAEALEKARACWLLALGELEVPGRRPGLVLVVFGRRPEAVAEDRAHREVV